MFDLDPVALAIDWLDTCKRKDLDGLTKLYAPNAIVTVPNDRASGAVLTGQREITLHWRTAYEASPGMTFELVELYPGVDSAVLVYYDECRQRVSEYLRFDDRGLIVSAARHIIPRQRQDRVPLGAVETAMSPFQKAVLRCEARQTLCEARRLPAGPVRNDLRQRAIALRELSGSDDRSSRQFAIG